MPIDLTTRDLTRLSSAMNLLADPVARGEPLYDKVVALARVRQEGDDVIITIDDKCPVAVLDNNVLQLQKQLAEQHGMNVLTVADVRNLKTNPEFAIVSAGSIVRVYGETTAGPANGEMAVFKRGVFMGGTQTMVAYPGAYGNQQGRFDAGTPLEHGLRELNEELVLALRQKGSEQISQIAMLSYRGETGVSWVEKDGIVAGLRDYQAKAVGGSVIPKTFVHLEMPLEVDPESISRSFNVRTIIGGKEMPAYRAGVFFETQGNTVEIAPVFNLRIPADTIATFYSCEPYGRPVRLVTPAQMASEQVRFEATPKEARTPDFLERETGGILCTLEPSVRGLGNDIGGPVGRRTFQMSDTVRMQLTRQALLGVEP